jgi:MtN3 and saliva related transmembrane protein
MMAEFWIESIGLVAGFIGIVAWIPQIRRVWIDEKEEGISLPTFIAVTASLSLWLVYGIIVNSIAMIVSNILTLAFIIAVTLGVYRIRNKASEDEFNKPTSSSQ